ncbi:Calycin-like containing protein [Cricetulus griseus]|nr:Calycin-like containing protein [Cricetulus griseus]
MHDSVMGPSVEYCSFKVYEELFWDFDGNCIESVDYFWHIPLFVGEIFFYDCVVSSSEYNNLSIVSYITAHITLMECFIRSWTEYAIGVWVVRNANFHFPQHIYSYSPPHGGRTRRQSQFYILLHVVSNTTILLEAYFRNNLGKMQILIAALAKGKKITEEMWKDYVKLTYNYKIPLENIKNIYEAEIYRIWHLRSFYDNENVCYWQHQSTSEKMMGIEEISQFLLLRPIKNYTYIAYVGEDVKSGEHYFIVGFPEGKENCTHLWLETVSVKQIRLRSSSGDRSITHEIEGNSLDMDIFQQDLAGKSTGNRIIGDTSIIFLFFIKFINESKFL